MLVVVLLHLYVRVDITTCELLEPDWYKSTWRNHPWLGGFDAWRCDTASREFTDEPWDAVEEDVRSNAGDDTIGNANKEKSVRYDIVMDMGTYLYDRGMMMIVRKAGTASPI